MYGCKQSRVCVSKTNSETMQRIVGFKHQPSNLNDRPMNPNCLLKSCFTGETGRWAGLLKVHCLVLESIPHYCSLILHNL